MADTHSTGDNKKGSFWDSTLGTIAKITALITAVTGLIVAINQFNSVSIKRPDPTPDIHIDTSKPPDPMPVPTSVINIGGTWRDVNNSANGLQLMQNGNSFQFRSWGILPQGIQFTSTGSGTITGQTITSTYTTTYQDGTMVQGNCSSTVSPDGLQMNLTCTDNFMRTFMYSLVRQ